MPMHQTINLGRGNGDDVKAIKTIGPPIPYEVHGRFYSMLLFLSIYPLLWTAFPRPMTRFHFYKY